MRCWRRPENLDAAFVAQEQTFALHVVVVTLLSRLGTHRGMTMSVPVVVLVVVGAIALGGGCDLRGAKIVEPRSGRLNPATGTARPDSREVREYETTSMGEELNLNSLGAIQIGWDPL